MIKYINPSNITNNNNKDIIIYILNSNRDKLGWGRYNLINIIGEQNVYSFTKSLLISRQYENRIYIIDTQKLGSGYNGEVYGVCNIFTYTTDNNGMILDVKPNAYTDSLLLVKQIRRKTNFNDFESAVNNEYCQTRIIDHLSPEEPIFLDEDYAYIVMKKVPGIELFELFKITYENNYKDISVKFLIAVTIAILKTIKSQILKYNIAHLDIKPENMLISYNKQLLDSYEINVEIITELLIINFVDYALASPLGTKISKFNGTPGFIAPERLMSSIISTEKLDSYSAGMTLLMLWGFDILNKYSSGYHMNKFTGNNYISSLTVYKTYNRFYKNHPSFNLFILFEIRNVIRKMISSNQNERSTIDYALAKFEQIIDFIRYLTPIFMTNYGLKQPSGFDKFDGQNRHPHLPYIQNNKMRESGLKPRSGLYSSLFLSNGANGSYREHNDNSVNLALT